MRFTVSFVMREGMSPQGPATTLTQLGTARKSKFADCDQLECAGNFRYRSRSPASPADVHHRSRRLHELRLAYVMPRFLLLNCTEDVLAQFRVVRSGAHAAVEVVLDLGKE